MIGDYTWETEESIHASNPELFFQVLFAFSILLFLIFLVRSFRGRKDLSGGECNNPVFCDYFNCLF